MDVMIFHLCAVVLLAAGGTVSFNGICTGRLGTLSAGIGIMLILVLPDLA